MSGTDTHLDAVMVSVLDVLAAEGGQAVAEPGRLLSALASEVFGVEVRADAHDQHYCVTAMAVRQLEALELIVVARRDEDHPQRGNRVRAIELNE